MVVSRWSLGSCELAGSDVNNRPGLPPLLIHEKLAGCFFVINQKIH